MEPQDAKEAFFNGSLTPFRQELAQEPQYAIMGDNTGAARTAADPRKSLAK